jgi:hypothetical protein
MLAHDLAVRQVLLGKLDGVLHPSGIILPLDFAGMPALKQIELAL